MCGCWARLAFPRAREKKAGGAPPLACTTRQKGVAAALRVAERAEWARESERREWNELMQEFFGNGQTPKYNGLNVYGDFGSR